MPQLTNVERAVIISKLEDNWSLRRIAAHMHVSKSCVFKIKTIWQTEQRTEKRARPNGLRKISKEEEDQALIQYVLEKPFTTSVNACAETHFPGCSKTVRRRLKEAGTLLVYKQVNKSMISSNHRHKGGVSQICFFLGTLLVYKQVNKSMISSNHRHKGGVPQKPHLQNIETPESSV
ncbi:hypothetical protein QE152_g25915 [Popillia japonica]|uniref:Transposase n=1 Tax=Popillia japonica TaxID=7064 RepID=A0AAW1K0X7_POPJA